MNQIQRSDTHWNGESRWKRTLGKKEHTQNVWKIEIQENTSICGNNFWIAIEKGIKLRKDHNKN